MCKPTTPLSDTALQKLHTKEALDTIEILRGAKVLSLDTEKLDTLFQAEPTHPVKDVLLDDALDGGPLGLQQVVVFAYFVLLAIVVTAFQPVMPLILFIMWGALGVGAGLLVRKYPRRFGIKASKRLRK